MAQPIKKENYKARLKNYGDFAFAYRYNVETASCCLLKAAQAIIKKYKALYDGARFLLKDGEKSDVYMDALNMLRKPNMILCMLRNLTATYAMEAMSLEAPIVNGVYDGSETTESLGSLMKFVRERMGKETFSEENLVIGTVKDVDLEIIQHLNTFGEPEPKPVSEGKRQPLLVAKFDKGKVDCTIF